MANDPKTNPVARLEARAFAWLDQRRHDRLLRRFGGTQQCPWCRQCAQDGDGWNFKPWPLEPSLDVLTCGVCGGTSVWLWGMGMHAMRPLDPPNPDPNFPSRVDRQGRIQEGSANAE